MRMGWWLLTALLLALAGCTPLVHADCSDDGDCPESCFSENRELPGGLCSKSCDHNDECPSGTFCIDKLGGICLVACSSMQECDDFHHGYICKDEKDVAGKHQLVCLGD